MESLAGRWDMSGGEDVEALAGQNKTLCSCLRAGKSQTAAHNLYHPGAFRRWLWLGPSFLVVVSNQESTLVSGGLSG